MTRVYTHQHKQVMVITILAGWGLGIGFDFALGQKVGCSFQAPRKYFPALQNCSDNRNNITILVIYKIEHGYHGTSENSNF